MFDKVCEILTKKDFIVPQLLISNYKKINILDEELALVIYLLNNNEIYDPIAISSVLDIDVEIVVDMVNKLCEKDIIQVKVEKQGKLMLEKIDVSPLYKKLVFLIIEPESKVDDDIYSIFEKEFSRTLSPIEYETIERWSQSKSRDLILLALKETIKRGITNIKYVDKILVEWEKKGIKNEQDVINDRISKNEELHLEGLDYNWLDETNS